MNDTTIWFAMCIISVSGPWSSKDAFLSGFPSSAWARSFIVRQMGPCLMGFPWIYVEFLVKGQLHYWSLLWHLKHVETSHFSEKTSVYFDRITMKNSCARGTPQENVSDFPLDRKTGILASHFPSPRFVMQLGRHQGHLGVGTSESLDHLRFRVLEMPWGVSLGKWWPGLWIGDWWNLTVADMGMDQYLLIPFLVGWTSIYQLFWCSPGVQGFDTLPYF